MEIRKTQLALTASALAMALMLVGCGGGGSSSSTPQPAAPAATAPTTPADTAPVTVEVPTLPEGDMYALVENTYQIEAGGMATSGGVTFTCAGEDCVVTIDGSTVTSTGGTVTAALTDAADMALTAQNKEKDDKAKADAAEMHERALGVAVALMNPSMGKAPTAKITRGETGAAMISVSGWTSSAAASAGAEGWSGMMFEGDRLDVKGQTAAVYTNKEAAKRKAFGGTGGLYTTGTGGVAFVAESGHLTLDATSLSKTQGAFLDKSRFPQPGGKKYTYGPASSDKHKREFPGTFRGASGTYKCDGDDCSVTPPGANTNDNYTLTGTWTFTPGDGQKGIQEDTSYMSFGWWMKLPSKADSGGDYVYDVEVFHRGAGATPDISGDLGTLTGTATYKGPAAGIYVNKTGEGDTLAAMSGTFTAAAELLANWDKAGIPATATLTGEITNFSGGEGMSDWSVKLGVDDVSSNNGSVSGKTSGTGTGEWSAKFYGGTGAAGTGVAAAPTGVHGMFDAHSNTTHIVGAFGAER